MEARCGRIILQQVDSVLNQVPSREALLGLLRISDPNFVEENLMDLNKRETALRKLKLIVHPDKHKGDSTATKRFQDLQTFYENCTKHRVLNATKKTNNNFNNAFNPSQRSQSFPRRKALPPTFHVQDKFTILAKHAPVEPVAPTMMVPSLEGHVVEKMMAFRCLNYRGTIIHGKEPEVLFEYDSVIGKWARSAYDVFHEYGGSKSIGASIEEIKEELMKCGPVVSTSFTLTNEFYLNNGQSNCFESSLVGKDHAVMIVGWKQTGHGEQWLVRSIKGDQDIPIFTGQFQLQDDVLAPASDLSNQPWQTDDWVLDVPNLPHDWYSWDIQSTADVYCKSEQLESLFKSLSKHSMSEIVSAEIPFVVREAERIARSRYAFLRDIKWSQEKNMWKVSLIMKA